MTKHLTEPLIAPEIECCEVTHYDLPLHLEDTLETKVVDESFSTETYIRTEHWLQRFAPFVDVVHALTARPA